MSSTNHIEDDYYAKKGSNSSQNSQETDKKKIKLKIKTASSPSLKNDEEKTSQEVLAPSKVLKIRLKQEPISKPIEIPLVDEYTVEENNEAEEAPKIVEDEIQEKKPKYFFQKIEVVSPREKKSLSLESSQVKEEEKKTFSFRQSDNTKGAFKSKWTPLDREKKWSDDSEQKKWKLSFHDSKRSKWKIFLWEDEDTSFRRGNKLHKKKEEKKVEDIKQNLVSRTWETVNIPDILSIKELSEKIGVPLVKLISECIKNGMMVTVNSKIDFESASIITEAFDVKIERAKDQNLSLDDLVNKNIQTLLSEDYITKLEDRPAVISIMWHVDHGKTSLLDYIRQAKVASGEAGGITQSIWAYQVDHKGKKITFLDTPWHEAFTVMRARGAKSTDIAILVVAADEGAKPQTIESINHAKEAQIPVIVAINKMDKEGANPDMIKSQIAEHGLIPEDWWGDTPFIPVSAKTGFWIDDLLEIITLMAEMKNLKANPQRLAIGTVIESHLDVNLGPVATVLINTGTLRMGDSIVCHDSYGKVKILKDHTKKSIKFWLPGDPILITGLSRVVEWWDILQVVESIDIAKQKAQDYAMMISQMKWHSMSGLETLMSRIQSGNLKQLKVLVKADTNGSLEAIKWALLKLSTEETQVQIIHSGVGNISEWDVIMCQWSSAILIWFRVWPGSNAKLMLQDIDVEFISSEVIYHITEKIEKIISGMFDVKEIEVILWKATVAGIFYTSKEFMILGLKVKAENTIESKSKARLIRNEKIVGYGEIPTVKQWIEEVNKFEGPGECGIKFKWNCIPEMWDTIEFYKMLPQSKK